MVYWVAYVKKITLYVDEKVLKEFDSKIEEHSRSKVMRYLMNNFIQLRLHGLAEGIIIGKDNDFLIQISGAYRVDDALIAPSAIIRVSKDEVLKHNLAIGDLVRISSSAK